jgi:hypothetical protein
MQATKRRPETVAGRGAPTVRVVAVPLARDGDMNRMVQVVQPLRRHAGAARGARQHGPGILTIALGDERQRTSDLLAEAIDRR